MNKIEKAIIETEEKIKSSENSIIEIDKQINILQSQRKTIQTEWYNLDDEIQSLRNPEITKSELKLIFHIFNQLIEQMSFRDCGTVCFHLDNDTYDEILSLHEKLENIIKP